MDTKSSKFRLLIVISVLWAVVTLLFVELKRERISDNLLFSDYAFQVFLFTSPLWLFWAAVYIWPYKFDSFFSQNETNRIRKENIIDENAIWNPNATVNWSFPFTPAFGSYLQSKNWRVLGHENKAKAAMIWFYISIVAITISLLSFGIYNYNAINFVEIWLFYIIIWYLVSGRNQAKYVKEKFGKDYSRRSWSKPILIGFGGWLAYNAAIIALIVS